MTPATQIPYIPTRTFPPYCCAIRRYVLLVRTAGIDRAQFQSARGTHTTKEPETQRQKHTNGV
ncbi:uncharacterized protein EI90DRAFT_3071067, partial [Cantharellus anzutake]|uniref:uncharacterized protein n=1 Tax=Cantharellus anzutake TaxID=1750568 RepID=UPI0019034958